MFLDQAICLVDLFLSYTRSYNIMWLSYLIFFMKNTEQHVSYRGYMNFVINLFVNIVISFEETSDAIMGGLG